jgi:hypothetical protein
MRTDELPAEIDGTHLAVRRVGRAVSFEWVPRVVGPVARILSKHPYLPPM